MKNKRLLIFSVFLVCFVMPLILSVSATNATTTTTLFPQRKTFEVNFNPIQPSVGNCVDLTVTNRNSGNIVSNAEIDIFLNSKKVFYGNTNKNGIFNFCPEVSGNYEVKVKKSRYREYKSNIDVNEEKTTTEVAVPETTTTTVVTTTTEEKVTTTVEEVNVTVINSEPATTTIETQPEVTTTLKPVVTTTVVKPVIPTTITTIKEEKKNTSRLLDDSNTLIIAVLVIVIIYGVFYLFFVKKKKEKE